MGRESTQKFVWFVRVSVGNTDSFPKRINFFNDPDMAFCQDDPETDTPPVGKVRGKDRDQSRFFDDSGNWKEECGCCKRPTYGNCGAATRNYVDGINCNSSRQTYHTNPTGGAWGGTGSGSSRSRTCGRS